MLRLVRNPHHQIRLAVERQLGHVRAAPAHHVRPLRVDAEAQVFTLFARAPALEGLNRLRGRSSKFQNVAKRLSDRLGAQGDRLQAHGDVFIVLIYRFDQRLRDLARELNPLVDQLQAEGLHVSEDRPQLPREAPCRLVPQLLHQRVRLAQRLLRLLLRLLDVRLDLLHRAPGQHGRQLLRALAHLHEPVQKDALLLRRPGLALARRAALHGLLVLEEVGQALLPLFFLRVLQQLFEIAEQRLHLEWGVGIRLV